VHRSTCSRCAGEVVSELRREGVHVKVLTGDADLVARTVCSRVAIGPISSIYDFLTFAVLLGVFHAAPTESRTGWFVESLATQTLVIFVIRTAKAPWASRRLFRGAL
jgi:magnesium-transporting ATPase (P-type)